MISFRHASLQTKLLVSFFLVILLATAAGYLFIDASVRRAFSDFTGRSFTVQDQVVVGLIVQYYNRTGSLDGLVDLLNRGPRDMQILLIDPSRKVVFAPDERFVGRTLSESDLAAGEPIPLPTGEIWTVVPYRSLAGQNALERAFLRTTQKALWFSGFTASAAALILVLFLVRQTTNPLRQLEAASHRIADGNFDELVDVRSSDDIGRLAQSFNEMAQSLKSSEEEKRRMIADISHDLRTPLAAVRSVLEGMRDGLLEPTPATFAALHDRVLLLTRLVADLHQLALADAGQLSIELRPADVCAIINGIVETVGFQMEDGLITFESIVEPGLPTLLLDAHRIEQVLLNLLENAIRHTPEGGRIALRAALEDDAVLLSVCDTGPGIAVGDLERVFERFYRADPCREGGSAGLGLSIARALVEAHGGRIWAMNRPEGGACFLFSLPTAPTT
jgi:signal transduction histidine kinase